MTRTRNYPTATSLHIFVHNFKNDLRSNAPPSDVRIFRKQPDGKEILIGIEPAMTWEQAWEINNKVHSRKNKNE